MRLGSKKRIYIRSSHVSKRKFSCVLLFILISFLLISMALCFIKTIRPVMTELAKSKVRFLAADIIDETVSEFFQTENITYSDIISIEKDESEKICAVRSNLVGVSHLKAKIALAIQQKIANLPDTTLSIPVGSLSGCEFLAGVGPKIKITLMPYGDSQAEFLSSFESAGINQTRLCINLHIKTNLALLMPTVHTACEIEDTVPVLQTIIVGEIPDTYLNVGGDFFGGNITNPSQTG